MDISKTNTGWMLVYLFDCVKRAASRETTVSRRIPLQYDGLFVHLPLQGGHIIECWFVSWVS